MRCHRKWTSDERGRYVELKRGILCIDCHMKIIDRLEEVKTRYAIVRRGVLQPVDAKASSVLPSSDRSPEQPLAEAKP